MYTVCVHARACVCVLSVEFFIIVHKAVSFHTSRCYTAIVLDVLMWLIFYFSKSFMLSTAGFTCVSFVAGALAWWGPMFVYQGLKLQQGYENITQDEWVWSASVIHVVLLHLEFLKVLNATRSAEFPYARALNRSVVWLLRWVQCAIFMISFIWITSLHFTSHSQTSSNGRCEVFTKSFQSLTVLNYSSYSFPFSSSHLNHVQHFLMNTLSIV